MKLLILGQGNVGTHLYTAFTAKHVDCTLHSSREGLDNLPAADCILYAVRDDALEQVAAQVHTDRRVLHLHTSGTMPLTVFGDDKPHAGVFYPLQSFSKSRPIEDYSSIPVFFEARSIDDVSAIYSLALMITSHVYEVSQQDREQLHLCGVLVNNFPNLMFRIAEDIARRIHVPFSTLLPLIDETAAKVHQLSPCEAQTGPAKRGDQNVMNRHLQLLQDPQIQELYRLCSTLIQKLPS